MGDLHMNLLNRNLDNNVDRFVNTMKEFFYIPIITKPTRVHNRTASLLDHFWINFKQTHVHNSSIIFSNITDHFPIIYYFKIQKDTKEFQTITYRLSGDECDVMFKNKLENHNWENLLDINSGWTTALWYGLQPFSMDYGPSG